MNTLLILAITILAVVSCYVFLPRRNGGEKIG